MSELGKKTDSHRWITVLVVVAVGKWILLALAAGLLALYAWPSVAQELFLWQPAERQEPLPAAVPPKATLAIAPLANQSAEEGYEWLGYAFAYGTVSRLANLNELVIAGPEDIREELANEQSELTLSDITSSAAAREAGKAVYADYVLIGNCAKSGDEIRVTTQIVEVATGNIHSERTGVREYANIFDFHAELVRWVAEALDLTTTPAGLERIRYKPTQSIPAYECFGQGVMHYYGSEYEEAAAACQKALDIDSDFADAYIVLARALVCQEKYEEAIAQLKKVEKLDADRPYLHYYLGIAYRENEDYNEAADELRQAVARKPQDIKVWRALGTAYLASAISHHNNFVSYEDSDESYSAMADSQQAANAFSRALELEPTLAEVYVRRAKAYYGMCDYDAAVADCNRAIEINPRLAGAYTKRGDAYDELGEYDKALADYNHSLSLEPSAQAYRLRGVLFGRDKQYDKAIADCTRALELDPEDWMAWNNRALAYNYSGQYDLAISDANRGLALDPNNVNLISNRAWAHNGNGDWDHAISDWTRSIELDPARRCWALWSRAHAYDQKGDDERALADCDRYLKDCWQEEDSANLEATQVSLIRARIYRKKGQYEKAIADYERALNYYGPSRGWPDRPQMYYEIAVAYKELGQFLAARECAEKALAGRPEHKEAQELLNELDRLSE